MTKTKLDTTGNGTYVYHAEVPFLVKPKTRKGFKIIGGVKYYLGLKGKEYRADLFDSFWTGGSATI